MSGAGILLGERLALTCAHVVEDPGAPLRVEFPGAPGVPPVGARVAEGGWFPEDKGPDGRTPDGDLALLLLDSPRSQVPPAPLRFAHPFRGRGVCMGGYTTGVPSGLWLQAKIAGASGHWVQLDPPTPDHVVRHGFSGAGVTDDSPAPYGSGQAGAGEGDVLGMIVGRYTEVRGSVPGGARLRLSYMLPVERITELLPQVAACIKGTPSQPGRVSSPAPRPLNTASRPAEGARPAEAARSAGERPDAAPSAGTEQDGEGRFGGAGAQFAAELAEWLAPGALPQPGVKLVDTAGDVRREAALSAALSRVDLPVDAGGGPAGALVWKLVERLGLPAPYAEALRAWLRDGQGEPPPLPGTRDPRAGARDSRPGEEGGPGGRAERPRLPLNVVVHGLERSTEPYESVGVLGRLRVLGSRVLVVMGEEDTPLRRRVTDELSVPALFTWAVELIDRLADLEHEQRHRTRGGSSPWQGGVATRRAVELEGLRRGGALLRRPERLAKLTERLRTDLADLAALAGRAEGTGLAEGTAAGLTDGGVPSGPGSREPEAGR